MPIATVPLDQCLFSHFECKTSATVGPQPMLDLLRIMRDFVLLLAPTRLNVSAQRQPCHHPTNIQVSRGTKFASSQSIFCMAASATACKCRVLWAVPSPLTVQRRLRGPAAHNIHVTDHCTCVHGTNDAHTWSCVINGELRGSSCTGTFAVDEQLCGPVTTSRLCRVGVC